MLVIFLICIGIVVGLGLLCNTGVKAEKEFARNDNIEFYTEARYYGGFPDIAVTKDNNMCLKIKDNKIILSKRVIDPSALKLLPKDILVDAEIMTQERITQEVKTGKLLVFGLLGFGMTDTKTQYINHLVITYKDGDKNRQVVFYIDYNDKLEEATRKIRNIISAA